MEQKEKIVCPVCGKATTAAKLKKYDELVKEVKDLRNSLELERMESNAKEELLEKKRKTIAERGKELDMIRTQMNEYRRQVEAFADENVDLRVENARLVNRGFWERLLNK